MKPYKIIVDTKRLKTYGTNTIEGKQGDKDSRIVNAIITADGVPLDLTNKTVTFYAIKPDKTKIFNSTTIKKAIAGEIEFKLTTQVLAVEGLVKGELVVFGADGSKLTSALFIIEVIKSINDESAIESQNEFTLLTDALTKLTTWDNQFETKYNGLEQEYATELTTVKTQLAENKTQINITKNVADTDYKAILEQSFQELLDGRLKPLTGTEVKGESKNSVVNVNIIDIPGTYANLKRVHGVQYNLEDLFENVDYTVDYQKGQIKMLDVNTSTRIEETGLNFVGTRWEDYTKSDLSGGAAKLIMETKSIDNPGNYVEFTFTGNKLHLITRKAAVDGIAKITIDSGTPFEVDLYNPTTIYQEKILLAENLSESSHTVRIEHANKHNPLSNSSTNAIFIDAIDYEYKINDYYDQKEINYKIDYIKYQGALNGINPIEGEDKFRFKILQTTDYAYYITDGTKSRPLPFGQVASFDGTGNVFKKIQRENTDTSKTELRSGLKVFVSSSMIDSITTAYSNIKVENTPYENIVESYGSDIATKWILVKPALVVVTDKARCSNFEVGDVALAVFVKENNISEIKLDNPAVNLFKINKKIKHDLINIVAYGDSITASTYLPKNMSYCERLELKLNESLEKNINVINKGDNGDKSTDLATTMYQVTEQSPDYVIIATGTNDQGYSVSTTDYRSNLITMINEFQSIGAKVLLMNMPYVDYPTHYDSDRNTAFAPYIQVLEDLSVEYNLPYIDYHNRFKTEIDSGNWDLFMHNDGTFYDLVDPRDNYLGFYKNIHPNIYGQEIIAEEIFNIISPLLV